MYNYYDVLFMKSINEVCFACVILVASLASSIAEITFCWSSAAFSSPLHCSTVLSVP